MFCKKDIERQSRPQHPCSRIFSSRVLQHKHLPYKFADLYLWIVVLSNREHVDELLRASDDDFSFTESVKDVGIVLLSLEWRCA